MTIKTESHVGSHFISWTLWIAAVAGFHGFGVNLDFCWCVWWFLGEISSFCPSWDRKPFTNQLQKFGFPMRPLEEIPRRDPLEPLKVQLHICTPAHCCHCFIHRLTTSPCNYQFGGECSWKSTCIAIPQPLVQFFATQKNSPAFQQTSSTIVDSVLCQAFGKLPWRCWGVPETDWFLALEEPRPEVISQLLALVSDYTSQAGSVNRETNSRNTIQLWTISPSSFYIRTVGHIPKRFLLRLHGGHGKLCTDCRTPCLRTSLRACLSVV